MLRLALPTCSPTWTSLEPQGSLLGPRVRQPIGGGTSYWGMGQWKSCLRHAEALGKSLSSGSHFLHLGKCAGGSSDLILQLKWLEYSAQRGPWQVDLHFNNLPR